jgi:signal transduction histidine kinase
VFAEIVYTKLKTGIYVVCVALAVLAVLGPADGAQAASQGEAMALVERAAEYWRTNGQVKAVAEINSPKGRFQRGDLYVFAYRFDGLLLANARHPNLVGQNHFAFTDPVGKQFVKDCSDVAKRKGSGWVEYIWTNPASNRLQSRIVWVRRIEGTDFYVGTGIWKTADNWP